MQLLIQQSSITTHKRIIYNSSSQFRASSFHHVLFTEYKNEVPRIGCNSQCCYTSHSYLDMQCFVTSSCRIPDL